MNLINKYAYLSADYDTLLIESEGPNEIKRIAGTCVFQIIEDSRGEAGEVYFIAGKRIGYFEEIPHQVKFVPL